MSTKKVFVELLEFLESNKDKTISSILPQIHEITESKKAQETIFYNEDGSVYAIFCYYHKQWEIISDVEYGKKASSKSGLNTMCKIGTNLWTKQQSDAKSARNDLITGVSEGKIKPADLKPLLKKIEVARNVILTTDKPKGFIEITKEEEKEIKQMKLEKSNSKK